MDTLTWEKIGTAVLFRFHGSIISDNTGNFRGRILEVLRNEKAETAIFHLGDADYIDSMGIGMFVHFHVQHQDRIRFLLCEMSPGVKQAFGYVKLLSFFEIRDTLNDVLEELNLADL